MDIRDDVKAKRNVAYVVLVVKHSARHSSNQHYAVLEYIKSIDQSIEEAVNM